VIAHDIDIALVEGPVGDDEILSKPWRMDVMKLIVSPQHHFAQSRDAIKATALNDEILILREPGSGSREVGTQALGLHAIEPK